MRAPCAVAAVLLGAAACLFARASGAQEGPAPAVARQPLNLGTRFGVESNWATFDQDGVRGSFFAVAGRADWHVGKRVDLRLLVPVYALTLDGSSTRVGVGDGALRVRVVVLDQEPWRVLVGLDDGLPFGASSLGVGQGAWQATPFVTAGYRVGPFVAYATAADALTARSGDKPAPVDYVDPSTDHEAHGTLGGILELGSHAYVTAAATGTMILVPGQVGQSLATAGVAFGLLPGSSGKVLLGVQAPIAGEHRYDLKLGLDAYIYF